MSQQDSNQPPKKANQKGGNPNNVVQMPSRCPVCSKKAERASFCNEHFHWFKAGLINRKGEKPKDFDKKFEAYMRKQAA